MDSVAVLSFSMLKRSGVDGVLALVTSHVAINECSQCMSVMWSLQQLDRGSCSVDVLVGLSHGWSLQQHRVAHAVLTCWLPIIECSQCMSVMWSLQQCGHGHRVFTMP